MTAMKLPPSPDSKVHGANMGPIWGRQDPGGPHVGLMNLAIWASIVLDNGISLLDNISCNILPIDSFKLQWDSNQNTSHFIEENALQNTFSKMSAFSCRFECVNLKQVKLQPYKGYLKKLLQRVCPFSTKKTNGHSWWRHQMETFSALLAICAGNSPVPGEFPAQRPVTLSFEVFFDLHLNQRLS